jgi:hypothetical protein
LCVPRQSTIANGDTPSRPLNVDRQISVSRHPLSCTRKYREKKRHRGAAMAGGADVADGIK